MWPCTQFYTPEGLILSDNWARRFRPATARYPAHFSQKRITMATEVLGNKDSSHWYQVDLWFFTYLASQRSQPKKTECVTKPGLKVVLSWGGHCVPLGNAWPDFALLYLVGLGRHLGLAVDHVNLVMYPLVGPEPFSCWVWENEAIANLDQLLFGNIQGNAATPVHQLFLLKDTTKMINNWICNEHIPDSENKFIKPKKFIEGMPENRFYAFIESFTSWTNTQRG